LDILFKSFPGNQLLQEIGYVSIFSNKTLYNPQNPSNIVPITHQFLPYGKEPHKFSVCVQPTFEYDRVFEFVQWMEFHKMMGVSHFTFYNVSIGPRVSCVMKSKAAQLGEIRGNVILSVGAKKNILSSWLLLHG
jgi:hypothetical protein